MAEEIKFHPFLTLELNGGDFQLHVVTAV